MSRSGETVLEAAQEADIELPFSCKGGVCSTCCAKVIKGKVEMQTNYALEDYEVERGLALTCQSIPLTDEITISFDEHQLDAKFETVVWYAITKQKQRFHISYIGQTGDIIS